MPPRIRLGTAFCCCLFASGAVYAHKPGEGLWKGSVELGWTANAGNVTNESVHWRLALSHEGKKWVQTLDANGIRTLQAQQTVNERYAADIKNEYRLKVFNYLYVSLGFETDVFSGVRRRYFQNLGIGRRLIKSDTLVFDVESGLGARQTRSVAGTDQYEPTLKLAMDLHWHITKDLFLEQELTTEVGRDTTLTRSKSELKTQVTEHVGLSLAYRYAHTSRPEIGIKPTDTETALAFTYEF